MFLWSYYKNLSWLCWDWRAIIAFQLGLASNKAHLNCPESNQGSLFSEKFGNFRRLLIWQRLLFGCPVQKGDWLESTERQQWVREGLESSILECTACPTLNQHKSYHVHLTSGVLIKCPIILTKARVKRRGVYHPENSHVSIFLIENGNTQTHPTAWILSLAASKA